MKTKLRNKWIRALRSGKYKQVKEVLEKRKGLNCCLGVLCRIEKVRSRRDVDNNICFDGDNQILTPKLRDRFGLSEVIPEDLATMNDDGTSFEEIADWIMENL